VPLASTITPAQDTTALLRGDRDATLKDEMKHPEIGRLGVGNVDIDQLERSIDILVEAEKLPRTPAVSDVFSTHFLPPASQLPRALF
jgi:NitT/TauT family transport system substrate-binding protein